MLKVARPLMLLACLALTAHAQDNRGVPKPAAEAGLCQPVCAPGLPRAGARRHGKR
ncbi:hypothetical protein P9875_16510 [Janthinobacterium rivuli]|uniref:Uncharacterized protein n=1 Tax=Janthinobacterium rivuli TaxID=2751478 RepID=A0ABY8HXI2_9BURK|nr:hypothetical protein [Janthinobacterium rivuli]WFR77324.1 hypothetical protein P9875_16510 [Janthinobacterium rivuli]